MKRNVLGPKAQRRIPIKGRSSTRVADLPPIPFSRKEIGIDTNTGDGQEVREIVKARTIAGSVCITLPKVLREPLGIGADDRVMVRLDRAERRLIVTKE